MIIGNGLMAHAFQKYFKDDPENIIFCSGVSNSRECNIDSFFREQGLLKQGLSYEKNLVYFSTCSVFCPDIYATPYILHKRKMESIIQDHSKWTIFRLPQVVGKSKNPNTLTNYIYTKIFLGKTFVLYENMMRNIIDVEDVATIGHFLIKNKTENTLIKSICSPLSISILQLVEIFEYVLKKKANYILYNCVVNDEVYPSISDETMQKLGVKFDSTYVEMTLRKYYG